MPWDQIIEIILVIIKECVVEEPDRVKLAARIRNPGLRGGLRLRRELRKNGLRGDELRDAFNECMTAARNATNEEIDGLIDDCKDCA